MKFQPKRVGIAFCSVGWIPCCLQALLTGTGLFPFYALAVTRRRNVEMRFIANPKPCQSFFPIHLVFPHDFKGMSKKTDEASSPKPDEPKPQRPMQPVMEPAPEPDPKSRATRPEKTDATTRGEKLLDAEEERIRRAKEAKASQG